MQYSALKAPSSLTAGDDLSLSITLKNAGNYDAEQVTQLYVRMPDAPVRTPNVSLKGFTRSALKSGQEVIVKLFGNLAQTPPKHSLKVPPRNRK